jgi:sulfur carrier protein
VSERQRAQPERPAAEQQGRETPSAVAITIAITVNGEEHLVERGSTVTSLLDTLGTERRGVAVAVDGEVVSRSAWDGRELGGGEHVEILSIARGG